MQKNSVLLRTTDNDTTVFSLPLPAFSFFKEGKPAVGQTLVLSAKSENISYLQGTYEVTVVVQGKGQELVPGLSEELYTIHEDVHGFGVRIRKVSDEMPVAKALRPSIVNAFI